MPSSPNCCTVHATSGVLPVPPVVRFPMLMTGTPAATTRRQPRSYANVRIAFAHWYTSDAAASPVRRIAAVAPRRSPDSSSTQL